MFARHFMTRAVLSLGETQPCRNALTFLRENGIRRAPVLREAALVGMVSERDLLRVLPGTIGQAETAAGADAERMPVARVMATKVITVAPDEHLEDAARKMLVNKVGGLPVVHEGRVVGILTESDVFRALVGVLDSRGVLRVSVARSSRQDLPPDPVLVATRLGFEVRGLVTHDRPGGESLIVLRLAGEHSGALLEAFSEAGYNVLEVLDSRGGVERRIPA